MPAADFFARFGFFVHQDLLDPETCLRIRSEMATVTQQRSNRCGKDRTTTSSRRSHPPD